MSASATGGAGASYNSIEYQFGGAAEAKWRQNSTLDGALGRQLMSLMSLRVLLTSSLAKWSICKD